MKNITLLASFIFILSCNSNTNNVVITYDTIDSVFINSDTLAFITADENYLGTLPCGDCGGILTNLSLNTASLTYNIKRNYLGKKSADSLQIESGKLSIEIDSLNNNLPPIYLLINEKNEVTDHFLKTSDSTLQLLDKNNNKIESALNYTLILKK